MIYRWPAACNSPCRAWLIIYIYALLVRLVLMIFVILQGHIQLEVFNIVPCAHLVNIVRLHLILLRYLALLDFFLLVELLPVLGVLVDGSAQILTDLAMQDVSL